MNLKSCVTQTAAMRRYTVVSLIMCQFVLVWTVDQTYTGGYDANLQVFYGCTHCHMNLRFHAPNCNIFGKLKPKINNCRLVKCLLTMYTPEKIILGYSVCYT
jgi:hypothetical protein